MPVAWDLIQLLAGLAFFGYLTFGALNSDELSIIKDRNKRRKARKNLRKIGNGFIISFILFLICGAADYLLHNFTHMTLVLSSFNINPNESWTAPLTALVVVTGSYGLIMVFYPMFRMYRLGDEEDALVSMQPVSFIKLLLLSSGLSLNTTLLMIGLPHIANFLLGGWLIFVSILVSLASIYLTWYYWEKKLRFVGFAVLQLLGVAVVLLAYTLGVPAYYQTTTHVVTYSVVEVVKVIVVSGRSTTTTVVTTIASSTH